MKISFFVTDLSANPIVRAWPLAQAAKNLGHDIEILGYIQRGLQVYEPYRDKTKYKLVSVNRYRDKLFKARQLSRMADGDIVYCCKPSLETLLPSIFATRWGLGKRLLLDAEDNELWTPKIPVAGKPLAWLKWCWIVRFKLLAHLLLKLCRYTATVSTAGLQKRYGGQIILHGPDEKSFDPSLSEHQADFAKKLFGLGSGKLQILFAGMPHLHKGVDLITEAVARTEGYELILAGDSNWSAFKEAKSRLKDRCRCVGMVPNQQMPLMLAAVDLVIVAQRLNDFTRFQMPAKLLEAMAMAKGVVVSDVSDLPKIVAAGSDSPRGWVCRHDNLDSLVSCLVEIANNPLEIKERGARARKYFLEHGSLTAIKNKLADLLDA